MLQFTHRATSEVRRHAQCLRWAGSFSGSQVCEKPARSYCNPLKYDFRRYSKSRIEKSITPRSADWSQWYLDVIARSDLMDDAPVRGCKVLKPNGFSIWERVQRLLDPKFSAMGVRNAYFPLLIPLDFFSKEAKHVAGFASECAVVTHHRLRATESGMEVDPESALRQPYVVRPTSETMVWHMFGRWISSHRDLPLKINQWVNVMRWEHRTKPFLRSSEFLWQEGHTAHASAHEADVQAREVLDAYIALAEEVLGLPLFSGRKSAVERFAGAEETYTIEVLTQNGMALQAGTSHFLGQNFAKAFDVTFQTDRQKLEHVFATSWGVSTRLIGAVIMVHSDDHGLVLPPCLAPTQVVICPITNKKLSSQQVADIAEATETLKSQLERVGLRVHVDDRSSIGPSAKYSEWESKGVPLRLELGARDLAQGQAFGKVRTGGEKFAVTLGHSAEYEVAAALETVQQTLRKRSAELKERLTLRISSRAEFDARLKEREPGFFLVPWGGSDEDEKLLHEQTGVTLRCYPFEQDAVDGIVCPLSGKVAREWAIFAKSY
mmetsp:Transcript_36486/g.97124  ORF Transcript_36486/g.97124 Transcript_36486/m.97124 type:complete len:549 (-) Transcript_36486:765-2411(-)